MTDRTLIPQALTDTAFAPFGRVLQVPADGQGGHAINQRTSQRFELVADALLTAEAGRPAGDQHQPGAGPRAGGGGGRRAG